MKLPFDCTIMDDEPVEVRNPFSGDSCTLTPEAVAVYDVVMGANLIGDYKTVQKGVSWFRQHYPREYMILLD
jgi:hypothetical protein